MKRESRYARTGRLLVLLLCALLLAGLLPTFGALADADSRTGKVTVSFQTQTGELSPGEAMYSIYKVGTDAPGTALGWKFNDELANQAKELADIIKAERTTDINWQASVNKLAENIIKANFEPATAPLDLSKGSATTPDLPFGVYLGVLTQAPDGMTANAALFTIPMRNADRTDLKYDVSVSVKETYTGNLTISKAVVSSNQADHDASYTFTIELANKIDQTFDTSTGSPVTFKAGVATVSVQGDHSVTIYGLPHGIDCTVTEVETRGLHPDRAVITGTISGPSQTAAFTNTETGDSREDNYVTVIKTDGTKTISGATFTLYDEDGTTEITKYTGGEFTISTADKALEQVLPAVGDTKTLTLKETSAPTGYTGSNATYTVKITASSKPAQYNSDRSKWFTTTTVYNITIEDKYTLAVINTPITGEAREDNAVTVTKTEGYDPITGATFTLYDGDKVIDTYDAGSFEISTANEALKDVLPAPGDVKRLTLKETEAPKGHKGTTTEYTVVISASEKSGWNEDHTALVTTTTYSISINNLKSINISNPRITDEVREDNAVTVTKTDGIDPITGATFTLYDGEEALGTYTGGEFQISTKDEILKKVLPEVGRDKKLILKETSAPAGYTGSYIEYEVVISASRTSGWNADGTVWVRTTTYSIAINNQASATVVNTPITGVNRIDDAVTVTKRASVSPSSTSEKVLYGATFTLYDEDGKTEIEKYTGGQFQISTADWELQRVLPAVNETKRLTLKETKAPKGYQSGNDVYVVDITASESTAWNADHSRQITTTTYTIAINGMETLDVPNWPITDSEVQYQSVTVSKVNEANKALKGAEFTLYSGDTAIKTYGGTDTSSFSISTKDKELKKYLPDTGDKPVILTLKETKAPTGYSLSGTEYVVKLTTRSSAKWNKDQTKLICTTYYDISIGDGKDSLTVVNNPIPTPTPTPTPAPGGDVPPPAGPGATPEPVIDISGTKVWVDESNAHKTRPGSIQVTLYADGSPVNATPTWSKGGDRWTFTFKGLPQYSSSGSEISYTVQETPVDGYESTVSGTTITNRLIPKEPEKFIELSGTKTWSDNDNASGRRPTHITVRLFRDGVEIESRTVTAGTDWKYTFGNLPVDDGYGNIYTYEMREDGVSGYFSRVDGMNVTNTLIGGSTPPTPTADGETPPPTGITPNVPQRPEDVPDRKTGTPVPHFEEKTDEELEELFDMFGYGTPLYGMLGTGDQVPIWVWICAGAGVLALILFLVMGKKKKRE